MAQEVEPPSGVSRHKVGDAWAIEGRPGLMIPAADATTGAVLGHHELMLKPHHGLEEVVVKPQLVLELAEPVGLVDRDRSVDAEPGPDDGLDALQLADQRVRPVGFREGDWVPGLASPARH